MMKRILGLLLAVCFALTCMGGALAEQAEPAPYTPGEITSAMFENLPVNTMTAAEMQLFASFGEGFAESTGIDADTLAAISEALSQAGLHMSVGEIDGGMRLTLGAYYGLNDSMVTASAALNITKAGLCLESNLLDRRITVTWETLLRLLGADDETIAALKSLTELSEEDITDALNALFEQLAVYAQKAGEVAAPYLEAVAAFATSLPMDVQENVPAENGFPAAASEITISCTDKALGELLIALADILEKDETLVPLLDQMIAGSTTAISHNGVTATNTAEACALLRTAVSEELTDETRPLQLIIAFDEDSMPVYGAVYKAFEDGSAFTVSATLTQPEENKVAISFVAGLFDAEGSFEDGMSADFIIGANADDPNAALVETQVAVVADGELKMSQTQSIAVASLEGDAPGMTMSYALSQTQEDAAVDLSMVGYAAPNEKNGENASYTGLMTVTAEDQTISSQLNYALSSSVEEDGPFAQLIFSLSTPDVGLDEYGISLVSYTYPYDPAQTNALEECALETATSEDMDALLGKAAQAAQEKLSALLTLLPAKLVEAMSAAE